MNRRSHTLIKIMHVAVEALTPLSIGSGRLDGFEDSPITLDAYGLPTIPGTALAGVIRSLYPADDESVLSVEKLFGFAGKTEGVAERSWASPLEISHGVIHDSKNKPVINPEISAHGKMKDKLIEDLRRGYLDSPPMRTRVRINERGVADADKSGLFDRTIVQRGTRFTFEICVRFDPSRSAAANQTWKTLQQTLRSATFRLGGGTRSGLGALGMVGYADWTFDLADSDQYSAYLKDVERLQRFAMPLVPKLPTNSLDKVIRLNAIDYWRIGNLARPLPNSRDKDDEPDMAPYTETCWVWEGSEAKLEEYLLVPATSIKGALRHRTAYHYNRLAGRFVDLDAPAKTMPQTDETRGVVSLFGNIKGKAGGQRGRLLLNDAFVPLSRQMNVRTIMHNSIDRFSGGVRDGALFAEQMVWKDGFNFTWSIIPGSDPIDALADKAFQMAVSDLCESRLAVGAASGRGHGLMEKSNV